MKKLIPARQDLASSEGAYVTQGQIYGAAWKKTWKGKFWHLYLTLSRCGTFDRSYWVWCYFPWHQCPSPSPQVVSDPRHTPSITGGLNQTRYISKPQATFCQMAQPRDKVWHWCGRQKGMGQDAGQLGSVKGWVYHLLGMSHCQTLAAFKSPWIVPNALPWQEAMPVSRQPRAQECCIRSCLWCPFAQ